MSDLIDRQAAINIASVYYHPASIVKELEKLPSVQLDWGKPVGDGRPLADGEVIARLQDIKKQIGGSYAIDRAIEVLKGLSSVQPTPCDVCRHNPPSSMGGKPCCICPAEGREG